MNFRLSSILSIVCVLVVVVIVQHGTEAKSFLDYWFGHRNKHRAPPLPEQPVGGKERYKQICRVINGIGNCYA